MSSKLEKKSLVVAAAQVGLAIDRALLTAGWGLSRRKIRQILDQGGVTVNQRVERFASYKVKRGDKISVHYAAETFYKAEKQQVTMSAADILYNQHQVIAINKPPQLSSQASRSPAVPHVIPVVEKLLSEQGQREKLILCHRLDKETSGVLLLARSEQAATEIMSQFKNRKVEKMYLAVCYGLPKQEEWEVTCYLSKLHPKTGLVHKVNAGGNWSHTQFKVVSVNQRLKLCVIACYPSTGRTHQIRVHLQHSHLPIVGDKKYVTTKPLLPAELASLTMAHHFLHARQIRFFAGDETKAESKKIVTIAAPLPLGMKLFCERAKLSLK